VSALDLDAGEAPGTDASSLPPLSLILESTGDLGVAVYIGDRYGMNNEAGCLLGQNINAVLNCTYEIHIDQPILGIEYMTVGYYDGPGNLTTELAAAVYCLDQLLSPRPPAYQWNCYVPKNVMVACNMGHSRSVSTLSFWLCQKYPEQYTYASAVEFVARQRGYPEGPTVGMRQLAHDLLRQIARHGEHATLFTILPPVTSPTRES
jgi:hypothetical protein